MLPYNSTIINEIITDKRINLRIKTLTGNCTNDEISNNYHVIIIKVYYYHAVYHSIFIYSISRLFIMTLCSDMQYCRVQKNIALVELRFFPIVFLRHDILYKQ